MSEQTGETEQNKAERADERGMSPSIRWLAVILFISAFLRFLSHPPIQFEYAVWVALIGYLFVFNRMESWTGVFGTTGVWSLIFYLPCLFWIRHISLLAWIGLSVVMVLFPLIFATMLWFLQRKPGWVQVFVGAGAWMISEYVQTHFLSGFPYLFLSHSQAEMTTLIQIADVTGAWGVSGLIFLVNGILYLLLEDVCSYMNGEKNAGRIRYRLIGSFVLLAGLFGGALAYGNWRLSHLTTMKGPDMGVIQGNIPLTMRGSPASSEEIFSRHLTLARELDERTDLVIWPETMFPYPVLKKGNRIKVSETEKLQKLAESVSADQILGARTITWNGGNRADFNSAWMMDQDGNLEQKYAKYHLVPFGEYVPGQSWIPGLRSWIAGFFPVSESVWLDAGPPPAESALMEWNGYSLAPMICYEVVFPNEFREHVRKGADAVINISNEAWYHNEAELDQMLSIVRLRCVEQRITTVRATNSGISGFVYPDGRATLLRNKAGQDRGFSGGMVESVKRFEGSTWYGMYGDWLIYLSLCGVLVLPLRRASAEIPET